MTWGWFQGGFRPTSFVNGTATCAAASVGLPGVVADYVAHHQPFQYFPSTRNPHHLPPTGTIGTSDQANHQYDLQDFFTALGTGHLPAVSFLKAKAVNDGHPGNSDPLDEQEFLVNTLTRSKPAQSGRTRPSSSPTMTPTAGMITRWILSSTNRNRLAMIS
jgi:phospholipase C